MTRHSARAIAPAALFAMLAVASCSLIDWDVYRERIACHFDLHPDMSHGALGLHYLDVLGWLAVLAAWMVPTAPLIWFQGTAVRLVYWIGAAVSTLLLMAITTIEAISAPSCNEWAMSIALFIAPVYVLNLVATAMALLGLGIRAAIRRAR